MSPTSSDDLSDEALIRATLAGEASAYRVLVERHGPAIQRRMGYFARDLNVREELVQDVFVQAYFGLASFKARAPFDHWLARIATRVGYAYWRRRDAERTVPLEALGDLAAPAASSEDTASPQPADAADLLDALFAQLPPEDRLVLTLAYRERCPQAEIARRLGCGRVRVAVRLHRARHKLRRLGQREPWKGRLAWILSCEP